MKEGNAKFERKLQKYVDAGVMLEKPSPMQMSKLADGFLKWHEMYDTKAYIYDAALVMPTWKCSTCRDVRTPTVPHRTVRRRLFLLLRLLRRQHGLDSTRVILVQPHWRHQMPRISTRLFQVVLP
ncbi:hypothetical protein MPSEU_001093300 [Mayamaea pseudoterrestris]|nr:hypothetical protein MPSEU_001093300 [Mayamaea pseudoterrestris]